MEVRRAFERDEKLRQAIARSRATAAQEERRAEREQRQRDMGIGYLVYAARKHARRLQADFARRVAVTPSTLCRWEHGVRLPTLKSLQRVVQAGGYELMVGLWDPQTCEPIVLGIVDDELPVGGMDLVIDEFSNDPLAVAPWRKRMGLA